jgi:N-acetylglucosamine-6-phosphate deacetylase
MRTIIHGGTVLTPYEKKEQHTIVIENGSIAEISAEQVAAGVGDRLIDASGFWATPGLIDLHIHGSGGYDTMTASRDAFQGMARFLAQHGVTTFLPTTVSADKMAIRNVLKTALSLSDPYAVATIAGIHIEGPFLNPNNLGAQPPEAVRPPDLDELHWWIESDIVRLITIAPELEGALPFIERAVRAGINIALGHTSASYDQFSQAIDAGASQSTHTFNSMMAFHHRHPGPIGAILTKDNIFAQIIVDVVHLHPAVVDLIIKAKGANRVILISDAISATGMDDGEYELGGHLIIVEGGIARIEAGNLAGSTLTLDQALRNVVQFTDLGFEEVLPMATSVPAQAMKWRYKGKLQPVADADIVIFNEDLMVDKTIVGGKLVFERE